MIPSLVCQLSSSDRTAKASACKGLTSITYGINTDHQAAALNANVIPPLISLLNSHSTQVQEKAAAALQRITYYVPAAYAAVNTDVIQPLVCLLSSNNGDTLICACGA
jgi:hypothetical protein